MDFSHLTDSQGSEDMSRGNLLEFVQMFSDKNKSFDLVLTLTSTMTQIQQCNTDSIAMTVFMSGK